ARGRARTLVRVPRYLGPGVLRRARSHRHAAARRGRGDGPRRRRADRPRELLLQHPGAAPPMTDGTDYDELWRETWGDMQHVGPVHRHIQHDLVRVVTALDVRSILDVGCGSGESLARLAALGRYELAGTDVSEEALALARRRAPSVRFAVLD